MDTTTVEVQERAESTTLPVKYEVTVEQIRAWGETYSALTCDTREGYEEVRLAIGTLRSTRTGIEKRRVELKKDALEYGRRVDSVAKSLTAEIEAIEEPLIAKKAAVDEAKERAKREKEAAEKAAVEAELRAKREALRPDAAKLAAYSTALQAVPVPDVAAPEACATLALAGDLLRDLCAVLDRPGESIEDSEDEVSA